MFNSWILVTYPFIIAILSLPFAIKNEMFSLWFSLGCLFTLGCVLSDYYFVFQKKKELEESVKKYIKRSGK
jgi:hypothetical protein